MLHTEVHCHYVRLGYKKAISVGNSVIGEGPLKMMDKITLQGLGRDELKRWLSELKISENTIDYLYGECIISTIVYIQV